MDFGKHGKHGFRYCLFTEGSPDSIYADRVAEILNRHFPEGFTIQFGTGFWGNEREDSLVATVIGNSRDRLAIDCAAEEITIANHQEAVLVTEDVIFGSIIPQPEVHR